MSERLSLALEAGLLGLGLLVSTILMPGTLVSSGVVLFCLFYASHRLAPVFLPLHAAWPRLFICLATLVGLQSILQTCLYYLGARLHTWTDAGTELVSLLVFYGIAAVKRPTGQHHPEGGDTHPGSSFHFSFAWIRQQSWWGVALIPALIGGGFVLIYAQRLATTEAIRTPWAILPPGILLAFVCVFAASWLSAWRTRSTTLTWIMVSGFLALVALVAPLFYPVGFGFDGFLHRASETILLQTGSLQPKPFYYIGQYTFVTWLARTLTLSLRYTDIFLLVGSIALLPATLALEAMAAPERRKQVGILLVGFALLLPLKPWITTTPQSFAYLIGLSGLLLATTLRKTESFVPALILGLWSIAIHPLAGLPLFGGIVLALWRRQLDTFPRLRGVGSFVMALGTALLVPLAFYVNSLKGGTQIDWHLSQLFSSTLWQEAWRFLVAPPVRIALWADWSAFIEYLFPLVLLALTLLGILERHSAEEDASKTRLFGWLSATGLLIMLAAWFMQQAATFAFLIDYERKDYMQRLFFTGQLFLLPAAIAGFTCLWQRVKRQPAFILQSFLLVSLAWQAARVYRAFPYHDATHIEHGWNTSATALEAVRWIDHDSKGEAYTVLADQAVSAGAVAELGFKRYAGDVFFYPIPTGGELYQVFLRAANVNVTQHDIEEAARLGQTARVYVVLNSYWWQAEEVAERLAALAGNEYRLGEGRVRVYRFGVNIANKR